MTSTMSSPSLLSSPTPDAPYAGAVSVLSRHAANPSAFLALNEGTRHFTVDGVDGLVAYRPAGRRTIVQFGGVFAAPADQPVLLAAFLDHARASRRRAVAVQLMAADAELYAASGYTVNQFGADYARTLADLTLRGKKHMQLRNKVSRARRAGVTVVEVTGPEHDEELAAVDRVWLRSKGRHVKELQLMVGQRGGPAQPLRRLFLARGEDGAVLAYVSFSPVFGPQSGWLHDLSRRLPDAPPGVLELVVVTAVEVFRQEGAAHLHFGFTPFTHLDPALEVSGHSTVTARIVRLLAEHGSIVYPAADQLAYKEKWGLDIVQPEYVAFHGGLSLRSLWSLLRVTGAV